MMYNATTGQTSFSGSQEYSEITLQQVAIFKYLGVNICSSPRGLFKAYNERVKASIGGSQAVKTYRMQLKEVSLYLEVTFAYDEEANLSAHKVI